MGKMKAKFRKGSRRSRTIIISLLLAILFATVGSVTAFAASARFSIKVAGKDQRNGMVTASLSETINFQSDKVFVGGNDMSQVYALIISSTNIGSEQGDSPVQLLLNDPDPKRWRWLEDTGSSLRLKYTVPTGTPLDATTFNSIMSSLSAVYNPNKNQSYAEGTITIEAYTRSYWGWQETLITKPYKNYSCKLLFYNYAEGRTDEDSAVMDYKSDYAASYDSKYEDDVPDDTEAAGLLVESPDTANGKAEFDLYLTQKATTLDPEDDKNYANIGKQVDVGYQVKESTEVWTSSVATTYTNHYELADVDISQPIHMTIDELKSGVTYNVRGVVATDGKKSTPKYTSELTFTYRKPIINSFNIGGVTKVYQGGKDKMNLSMRSTFNDVNAIGETYTGIDGMEYTGPAMKAEIYFTNNRVFQEVQLANSEEVVLEDHSKWYRIQKNSDGTNASITKTMTDQETGEVSNAFTNNWLNFTVPSSLHDINDYANTNEINSTTCAFKLVITDLYTGYTSVMYSDCFTIDAGAPSAPTVKATSGGVEKNLDLGSATVVGGTSDDGSAQVKIEIGGSDDHGGSGIKQYSYSMYYLPTDKVPNTMHTTAEVLNMLQGYTPETHGFCDYKSWAPLSAKLNEDGSEAENVSELIVSKDGYYRIIARAEDEAGFTSETVEGYFRVDLTPPTTPVVRLAKKEGGTYKPYDNRTYTDSNVWLFAWSEPQTGKSLSTFKYSTDGGLTWKDVRDITNTANKIVVLGNTSSAVSTYPEGSYTGSQNFVYQVGIGLSSEGFNDYVSVLVKAVDNLGNESMVSNPVVMRTIADAPKATSVLEHEGIEVALALGNTEMITSRLTQDLKNQAAYKINEKYYGTSGSATVGAADFNPWKYLLTLSHGSGRAGWKCTWGTDSSCTGACHSGTNCPYAKLQAMGYEMFTPEVVNVQGMSGANASNNSMFQWVRYDHTMYAENATAGYTSSTVNRQAVTAAKPTNMEGNAKNPKDGLYISSKDRVIAMNQTGPATRAANGKVTFAYKEDNNAGTDSYTDIYNRYGGVNGRIFAWNAGYKYTDDKSGYPSKTNIWVQDGVWGQQIRRIYHVMDLSYARSYETSGSVNIQTFNLNSPSGNPMSTIGNAGYTTSAFRDWLFLYNDQPARKTIFFTVDDSTLQPHASDGYGFLFNTTIRQSKAGLGNSTIGVSDGSWRISGYLFYIGNQYIDRYDLAGTGGQHTEGDAGLSGFRWYVMKLDDVNLEHFADGSVRGAAKDGTSGYGKKNATEGGGRALETPLGQLATDGSQHHDGLVRFLMYGGDKTEGLNANYWISSNQAQGSRLSYAGNNAPGINYGITQLAMSTGDVNTTKYVRNFVIQTEGKQAKFYVYNSGSCSSASSKKTSAQLISLFESQVTEENPTGASSYSAGYRMIQWNTQDSSTYVTDEETGARQVGVFFTPRPTVDGIQIGKKDAKLSGIHADTNCYGFGPLFGARSWSHWCYADTRVEMSNIVMQVNVARKLSEVVNEPQWGTGKAKFIANISDDSTDDFQDPVLSAQVQWRLFTDKAKFMGWGEYDNREATMDFISRVEGDGTYISSETSTYDEIKYTDQVAAAAEYITREYFDAFGFDANSSKPITQQVSEKVVGKGAVYSLDDIGNINFSVSPEKYNTSSANPDYPSGRWYIVHDTTGYPAAGSIGRSETYSDALELKITEPGRYTIYFAPDASKVKNNTLDANDPTCVFDFIVNTPPVALFSGFVDNAGNITIENSAYDPDVGLNSSDSASAPNGSQNTYTYTDQNGVKQTKSYNNIQLTGLTKTEWRWEVLDKKDGKMYTVASNGWSTTNPGGTLANLTNGHITPAGKTLYGSGTIRLNTLPSGAVLTVYQRVTDTSTHRVAKYSGGNFVGYEYQAAGGMVSKVNQQNLTSGTTVTYAPLSAFSMSSPIIYDTAIDGTQNSQITITRKSKQTQKKNSYNVSWAIDLGSGYQNLLKSGNNYYLGSISTANLALRCTKAPVVNDSGEASGEWILNKKFLSGKIASGKSLTLQITETIKGLTQEDVLQGVTTEHNISDSSARAIYYSADKKAPSPQAVTSNTVSKVGSEEVVSEYQASNYLDVTGNDKFIQLTIGGSVDSEGEVAGYGFYFYDRDNSGTETAYYKLSNINGSGTLQTAANAKNALYRLGKNGGTVRIGKNAMKKTPNDSLNIAIFAYDNQTGVTTGPSTLVQNLTGANETARTKIEGIKLSVSKPMPPAVSVTNMLNQNVVRIGNDNGYFDSTGADTQNSDLSYYSATNVTVSFAPRKAKYSPSATGTGELVLDEAKGQEYYQDYYKQADLTGVANVRYSVKYKETESESWWTQEQLEQAAMSEIVTDKVIPSAQTLTFTRDGVYEITASIVNGSGNVSATRTVKFTIDKTAPAGLQVSFANINGGTDYLSNSWSQGVKIVASGATDTNAITAKYQYTTDGGKTWIDMGALTNPSTSVDITKSGKYTVQVRAIDLAGNETVFPQTVIVCVDTTAPVTNGPTLTASSTMRDIYDSYVISLKYDDADGKVYSILDGGEVNMLDKEVAVPIDQENSTATETVYGDVVFELHPAEGHIIGQVVYKGEDITDQVRQGANQDVYYLSIDRVSEDAVLSVTFPETELEPEVYRSVSRATFAMSSATAVTFNSLKPDQGISTVADEGEGSEPDGGESGETPEPGPGVEMYTVTANSASPRGKVALSAEEVLAGGKVTLTMTPNKGCRVKSVEVNGSMIDLEDIQKQDGANVYTYELTVLQDTAIWVDFETIPTRLVRVQYNTDCGEFVTLLSDNDSVMDQGNNTYRVPVNEEIYIHMGAKQGYGTKSLLVNGEAPADFAQGASTCPYTAPEWTEEGTDPGIDIKVEFDVITTLKRTYQVSVGASAEDGNPHGTIVAAGDDVRIPVNGARTFIITPELGYKVEHLYHSYTSADNGPETVDLAEGLQPMPGTSIRQYMYTLTNPVSDGSLEVIFERQTYRLTSRSNKGGMVGITPVGGVSMTLDRIPEGASVVITPTPQDGYRVQDLIITENANNSPVSYSVGAVTSYTLSNIHANIEVEVKFVRREISRTETTHMITAVANGIKDADDALASKPYRFCIADGPRENSQSHVSAWSEWSESNTCSYTEIRDQKTGTVYPLEPNQRYYVYVMARDRVGNESEPKLSTVYSMANMAAPLGAEALDDAGNSSTKSVALQIDPNGNPDGTEYLVYTSNSSSMTDMTIANADVNGGWAKLGADNRFIITGLTPGRWYHMQVVARNSDGIVSRMSDDVSSLMLSPAAPPMDSFWFEEQTSPNSPVILHWLEPSSEVTGIQIYRDGMFLAELPAGTLSYTDERNSFAADSIFKYSYAYVNSAGAGSTTTAISEEYYNAHYGSSYDEAKVEKMGNLITSTGYDQLFSETMTYPCYPDGCKEPVSASTPGGTDNSGTITVQMNYNALLSGRYQKYFLTLKAFEKEVDSEGEPVLGEDGKPIYHEVGIEKWDPTGTNRNGDGTQKWKETKVTQVMGETAARATWTNLSTLYEYNIYVEEIRSNGATSADNLGGQNGQGVEYSLGKEYVVNREGYYYRYAKDTTEPRLNTGSGSWTTEALLEYTKKNDVAGWDRPVNNNYITFNKSPSVKLATEADRYYDNDSEKVRTSTDGKQYLLVDNSMSSKTFHINVAAWDPDGAREESNVKPAVKGTISGVQGAAPEFAAGESMPKSEELATQRGNLYPVTFDGATLNTGVYNTLEMRASDSDTTTTQTTNDIRLVINRNVPSSSIVGSASKRIENKRAYSMDELVQVNSMVSSGNGSTSLSKVALLVMPNEYQTALGSSDYDTLYQQLCVTGDATVVNKAKALLGTAATSPLYVNGSKLTEAGMNLAIARVAPPVTKYITITEEQYNSLLATVPDKVMKDVGSKTTYWLELNYALANSYCTWLQTGEGGKVVPNVELKPTDKENTYMMKLVTRFGGNPTSQTVDFVIKDAPSTQILSKKSFVWKDTAKEEYDYYKTENFTVQQIIDKYHDCYVPGETTMEDPLEGYTKETSPAFTTKTVNGQTVYLVYKLIDSEGNVGNDFISGEVRTNLGVHKQFDEVGVVLVTDAGFDPNTTALPATAIDSKVYKNDNGREPIVESGDLRFGVNGLTPGVTYWLWSYYKLPGEERVYSRGHVALTTEGNFPMAQYGFTRGTYSYKEKDYPDGRYMSFNIGKLGSVDASATVRVTPVYYAADEYGTILRNEADEPIELTGDQLEAAKRTLFFSDGSLKPYETITFGTSTSKDVSMVLLDNEDQQGHMVVRLMLTIENSDAGYCYLTNGGDHTDIFIQDDESPVTSYILGVINEDADGEPFMEEISSNGALDHYEYQFAGLQVDYTQLTNLTLSYENRGTGDLEDIKVTVYDDREGKTVSSYFEAERPSETNLKQSLGGIGTVDIHPVANLEDGVYEGWVFLTAEHVEQPVKVKVRQVVGQSTLKGRIYITPEMMSLNVRTGVAKISIYDASTTSLQPDGTFDRPPVYTTESNEYGGEFEIPNILNKGSYSEGIYYVVVERDGFLTYNGRKYRQAPGRYTLKLGTTSATYTMNLRLIGGDVNGDQKVNDTDLNILISYYNRYSGMPDTDPAEEAIIKRCDFNQDGVVNALDRMFLLGNLGTTDADYPYESFLPIPADE